LTIKAEENPPAKEEDLTNRKNSLSEPLKKTPSQHRIFKPDDLSGFQNGAGTRARLLWNKTAHRRSSIARVAVKTPFWISKLS
jgi:hypothetical protein